MAKVKTDAVVVQTNALAAASKPAGFLKPLEGGGGSAVYVQFAHPQAPNYQDILSAPGGKGLKVSTPCLIGSHVAPIVILAPMFEFIKVPHHIQYWCDMDSQGAMTKCYTESMRFPAVEFIDSAVIILHKGEFIPATVRCRGPKCQGMKQAESVLGMVDSDEWLKIDKEHGMVQKFKAKNGDPLPLFAWYINVASISPSIQSKQGRPYETMTTQNRPISAVEAVELLKASADELFTTRMSNAMHAINMRKDEVDRLC